MIRVPGFLWSTRGLGCAFVAGAALALWGCGEGAPGENWSAAPPPGASWPANAADAYMGIATELDMAMLAAAIEVDSPSALTSGLGQQLEAAQPQVLQLLTASQIDTCDYGVGSRHALGAPVPFLAEHRLLQGLLATDAMRMAKNGKDMHAAERLVATLRMGEHGGGELVRSRLLAAAAIALVTGAVDAMLEEGLFEAAPARAMVRDALVELDPADPAGLLGALDANLELLSASLREPSAPDLSQLDPEIARIWSNASPSQREAAAREIDALRSRLQSVAWGRLEGADQIAAIIGGINDALAYGLLPNLEGLNKVMIRTREDVERSIDLLH